MKQLSVYILVSLAISSNHVFAEDGKQPSASYRFGGACTIRGAWTQSAAQVSASIKSALSQLAQIPECAKLNADFQQIIPPYEAPLIKDSPEIAAQANPAIGEVQSINLNDITMSAMSGGKMSGGVMNNVLGALVDKSTWGLEFGRLYDPKARGAFVKAGLGSIDNLINIMPMYQQCLMNNPQLGTKVISGTIKLLSIFSSSNDSTLSGVGSTIDKLVKVLNDSKFVSAQSKLDYAELTMSISCLLESASQNYCSTLDAIELQNLAQKQQRNEAYARAISTSENNPMEGYIILTREIKKISGWLQQVMYGVEPRNSSDSGRKVGILSNISNFQGTEATIQGKMGDFRLNYSAATSDQAKKNLLLSLATDLTTTLVKSSDPFGQSSNEVNFFSQVKATKVQMFFYLLGMDVPDIFIPKDGEMGYTNQDPSEYVSKGGKFIPLFDRPDDVLNTITQRLDDVTEAARVNASAYFQQMLIVDKAALVDKAILKQTISIYDSFKNVDKYLTRLINRIESSPQDDLAEIGFLPDMISTREAIRKVIAAFDKQFSDVHIQLQSLKNASANDKAIAQSKFENAMLGEKFKDNIENIISEVYVNFNMINQRDTYLLNRMSTFVSYDYSYYTQHPGMLTPYVNDLLVVSASTLLDDLAKAYDSNPAKVQADLASAQTINLTNIKAIEYMFRDTMMANIRRLKDISTAKGDGYWTQVWSSVKQRISDTRDQEQIKLDSMAALNGRTRISSTGLLSVVNPLSLFLRETRLIYNYLMKSDRYKIVGPMFRQAPIQMDDSNHSFEQLKSRFCLQTLQFTNYYDYFNYCQGSVLNAWQSNSAPASVQGLNASYNDYYSAYIAKAEASKKDRSNKDNLTAQQLQYDKNICVLRDYLRKNYVEWLTQSSSRPSDSSESADTDSFL